MKIAFTFNKKNIFSKIIAYFTKSQWSHCFMLISALYDSTVIAEASFHGGVKLNLLSQYQDSNIYNMEIIDVGDIETDESKRILISKIGDAYGYAQILGDLIAKIFRLKKNPFTSDEVCSEYVWLILKSSTIKDKFIDMDPNTVSPEDLYKKLKSIYD